MQRIARAIAKKNENQGEEEDPGIEPTWSLSFLVKSALVSPATVAITSPIPKGIGNKPAKETKSPEATRPKWIQPRVAAPGFAIHLAGFTIDSGVIGAGVGAPVNLAISALSQDNTSACRAGSSAMRRFSIKLSRLAKIVVITGAYDANPCLESS